MELQGPAYYRERVKANQTEGLMKKLQQEEASKKRVESFLKQIHKRLDQATEWDDDRTMIISFPEPTEDQELYKTDLPRLKGRLKALGWMIPNEDATMWHHDHDGPILQAIGIKSMQLKAL